MEAVIGAPTGPAAFDAFLRHWNDIHLRHVAAAATALGDIPGVSGLILAGGLGRGAGWPLSDIDLIPIVATATAPETNGAIAERRDALAASWASAGEWVGLDVGKLTFTTAEVETVLAGAFDHDLATLLADDRWYHSLDKGYQGRTLIDPTGQATALASWLTAHRFAPPVVALRRARITREREGAIAAAARLAASDRLASTIWLRTAVKWVQTGYLEARRERDNSQGRLGTRFARLATARGDSGLVQLLDDVSDLDPVSVWRRVATAPDWVRERHDRSWRARRLAGEAVSQLEDWRDTLRVCALYGSRDPSMRPERVPAWLAVPCERVLVARTARLAALGEAGWA